MNEYIWTERRMKNKCPFCGSKTTFCYWQPLPNVYINHKDGTRVQGVDVSIHCHGCGATVTGRSDNKDAAVVNAIKKWETRV